MKKLLLLCIATLTLSSCTDPDKSALPEPVKETFHDIRVEINYSESWLEIEYTNNILEDGIPVMVKKELDHNEDFDKKIVFNIKKFSSKNKFTFSVVGTRSVSELKGKLYVDNVLVNEDLYNDAGKGSIHLSHSFE